MAPKSRVRYLLGAGGYAVVLETAHPAPLLLSSYKPLWQAASLDGHSRVRIEICRGLLDDAFSESRQKQNNSWCRVNWPRTVRFREAALENTVE